MIALCKNRTLLVLKHLWENTDEHSSVSLADISKYTSSQDLPDPDSRSLKKNLSDDWLLVFWLKLVQFSRHIMSGPPALTMALY